MWRTIAIACGALSCLATAATSAPASSAPPVINAMAGTERFAIERAIAGAARRLAEPECQRVLEDFADPSGRTLAENLAALGKTPVEFFNELYFLDDRNATCCLQRRAIAFTAPGHRVIRVCAPRFAQVSLSQGAYAEAIMIHEMLHALGLHENPPRSRDITARVIARCK